MWAPIKGPSLAGRLGPRGKGALLARRSLGVAGWGAALSRGTWAPQRGGLCRTFCLCCVFCPTSCPFSQAWGRERFQPVHSFKVCPDRSDSEAVGPRTHSARCQLLLPPPLPLIGEGRRVPEAPSPGPASPLPGSGGTFEHHCLYSTHLHK